MRDIPYDFDLLFDIKTKKELIKRYKELKEEIKDIEDLIKLSKLDINIEIS